VFTDAILKIYLTASAEARAERRYKQLKDKGMGVSLHDLFLSIQTRDEQDMNRAAAPLRPAADALLVDSTEMALDEVFALVLAAARASLGLAATVDQPA
jgi:CMP/dCMP kinase